MNNIFVVRTPLQLLSAYIVAHHAGEKAYNHLILVNPRGNKLWHSTYSLRRMSTDSGVWREITTFTHRVARRSELFRLSRKLRVLKQRLLANGKVDQVYLGADREFDNQLLVELADNTSYVRLEDGVWSYASPDRSWVEKITMWLWGKLVRWLAGIKTNMPYNYRGGGYGQAATADLLFKPELLQRPSPRAVAISQQAVHAALTRITQGMDRLTELDSAPVVLFLGSIFVDKGLLSRAQELEVLKIINTECQKKGMRLLYKPHPFEQKEKLAYYQRQLPELKIIDIADPIEIIYYSYTQIKAVIAHSSSGLLYADIFSRVAIVPIAVFAILKMQQNETMLTKIMQAAGVKLPLTLEELKGMILSIV